MTHPNTTRFSSRLRLLCGLALLLGLCIMLGGLARPAHAQSTLSVSDCSSDTQLQAAVAQANTDNAGDVITFACSGDLKLTSTLSITGSMSIDGSGQSVTLDGGDSVKVLFVKSVSFTLKSLTIAHGSGVIGGGLQNLFGTVTISNSTFANNLASGTYGDGGGLVNASGTVSISNSTFANNSARFGGGLLNSGKASISNSTFDNNSATRYGGLGNGGTVSFSGSIVAANTGGDCSNVGGITDNGYNLSSDSSCGFTGTGSVQNTDPKLGSLASNGGPTQTLALQDGSPAIDAIPLSANLCPGTDQRGNGRPDTGESSCDMGAYEFADPADKDLGLSNLPADQTVNASSPKGAVVTYPLPTMVDESGDSSTASVSCTPASGSTFAIGTTRVTCSASDSDDTNSPVSRSFTVTVKGAAAQVSDLVTTVDGDHLPPDFQASFDTQLQAVQADLAANNTAQACRDLTAFSNHAQAQSGKGLTSSQATQLIAAARQVQAVLGC